MEKIVLFTVLLCALFLEGSFATEGGVENLANPLSSNRSNCYQGTFRVTEPPFGKCSGFRVCDPGSYCSAGIKRKCPASTYGDVSGLETSLCSGVCPAGYYCPKGTVHPIECGGVTSYCPEGSAVPMSVPEGYYTVGRESVIRNTQHGIVVCPAGHFCTDGVKQICPAGYYGDTEGLSSNICSGPCPEGYYCPSGSSRRSDHPCSFNNPELYCPAGTARPFSVKLGYYAVRNSIANGASVEESAKLSDGGFSTDGGGGVVTIAAPNSTTTDLPAGGYTGESICPPGSYCIDGIRYLCAAGRYGNIYGETNSSCTGSCAVGFYCPAGSVSKIQVPCGSHHQYCPADSGSPVAVSPGHYTLHLAEFMNPENSSDIATDEDRIRYMEQNSLGAFQELHHYNSMRAGNQSLCEPGYYCLSDGIRRKCPVGRYGATYGLKDASCTGPCPQGYYCPEGSSNGTALECGNATYYCPVGAKRPYQVSPGYYTAGGLTMNTSTTERKCPPGKYCSGDGIARLCEKGRYGSEFGLVESNCSGACLPGYYCPEGSTQPTEVMCGDASYYCPPVDVPPYGNWRPTKVSPGYYTVGSGGSAPGGDGASAVVTRTGQKIAERGYYAVHGIRYICSAGKYGAVEGLTTSLCSGYCDVDGYYCPAGSVSPKMKACGGPNVICPHSTAQPLLVRPGYYTSDPRLETCGPGQYRNWSSSEDASFGFSVLMPTAHSIPDCQLCPEGTYKNHSGDSFSDCRPCNAADSQSSANRVTCECLTVFEEGYTSVYDPNTDTCTMMEESEYLLQDESYYESNTSFTRHEEFECEPGYYCTGGLRYICPPGYYGSKYREHSTEMGSTCEGKCATGYYCPEGSTSPYALPCGGADQLCPEGSAVPTAVSEGYYSNEDVSELYRSEQFPCPPGYYCHNAKRHLCPPGTYADKNLTSSPECAGLCDAGYYCEAGSSDRRQHRCGSAAVICPRGSHAQLPVLNGFYSVATGDDAHGVSLWDQENTTQSAQIPCEPGYYCTGGIKYPCPPGTYGWRYGLNSSECSGQCAPGYYCPSYLWPPPPDAPVETVWPRKPHTSAAELECGGTAFYCPRGSFFPQRVGGGNYTTGGGENNQTRRGQEICTPGNYCVDGVIQPCPKGKYGITPGLAAISCTGWCPPAHSCPLGTAVPIECTGQTYNVGAGFECAPCPGDNNFTLPCHDSRFCCFQGG